MRETNIETEWLRCIDCGESFELPATERAWFEQRGFVLPKRCRPCRATKRARFAGGDHWDRLIERGRQSGLL